MASAHIHSHITYTYICECWNSLKWFSLVDLVHCTDLSSSISEIASTHVKSHMKIWNYRHTRNYTNNAKTKITKGSVIYLQVG